MAETIRQRRKFSGCSECRKEAVTDGSAVRSELRSIGAHEKGYSGGKEKDSFFEQEKEKIYLVASSQSSEGAVV